MTVTTLMLLQAPAGPSRLGTLYETILDGGWMMIPIALCSVLALGFFVERGRESDRGDPEVANADADA